MRLFCRFPFFVSLLFCVQKDALGQGWERVYNEFPLAGESGRAVAATADGGILMLGVSGEGTAPGPSSYLQKVDADGQIQWKTPLFPQNSGQTGFEAWKMARLADGRLAFLAVDHQPQSTVPTFWTYVCDENGQNGIGPTLLVATAEARKAWDIAAEPTGGYFLTGRFKITPALALAYVQRHDANSSVQSWPIAGSDSLILASVAPVAGGGCVAAGFFRESLDDDPYLIRLSATGQKLWDWRGDDAAGDTDSLQFLEVAPALDGGFFCLLAKNMMRDAPNSSLWLQKFSSTGQPIWTKPLAQHISVMDFAGFDRSKMLVDAADGSLAILFETFEAGPAKGGEDAHLMKVSAAGDVVWDRVFGRAERWVESPFDLAAMPDGGWAMAAWMNDQLFQSNDAYLVRTNSAGLIFSNQIEGRVFFDQNLDCVRQTGEKDLAGWLVQGFRLGELSFSVLTGTDGKFMLPTDLGQTTVKITPPSAAWDGCQLQQTVSFSAPFDTATVDFAMQAAADCPILEADLSTLILRRCFESTYTATWANRGTVAVAGAVLQVELDPFLAFKNASPAPSSVVGQTLFFDLGTLEIGAFGQAKITVEVDCDSTVLGQAHCSTASISPSEICLDPQNWSGAHIEVEGDCAGSTVAFKVKNTGNGAISTASEFIIIEEELILMVGQVHNLPPGADTTIAVASNGHTFRIDASPEPFDPQPGTPSVAVEGCGGPPATGYVALFPSDDGDPTSDTDCRENVGSFDPNRKDGFPIGLGESRSIWPDTEIEYVIQFQNTGSDTAFSVVLRDTLSEFLDLGTLKMGASSHPYRHEFTGPRALKITFSPIALVDSTANEKDSKGFVAFKITPRKDAPLKSWIFNRAGIYFDFNAPVITNTTRHHLDTGFLQRVIVSTGEPKMDEKMLPFLRVAPQPVGGDGAWVELRGFSKMEEKKWRLVSPTGQILKKGRASGDVFWLEKGGTEKGLFWLEVIENERVMAVEKIIFE